MGYRCYRAGTMVIICDISALRLHDRFARSLKPCRVSGRILPSLGEADLARLDVASARETLGDLHVIVPSKGERKAVGGIISHVCTTPLPPASVQLVKSGVGVASVALCVALMSRTLDDRRLIRFLYELCATYRVNDYLHAYKPLANRDGLRTELMELREFQSSGRVLGLLDYVADGSASPRETDLAMLAWLPHRLGGYGLPLGMMNTVLRVGASERRCDLLFPRARVGVEYDSDELHSEEADISHDSARRTSLENKGYRIVQVTNGELRDGKLSFEAMRLIGRHLGLRVRVPRGKNILAREKLLRFVNTRHVPLF